MGPENNTVQQLKCRINGTIQALKPHHPKQSLLDDEANDATRDVDELLHFLPLGKLHHLMTPCAYEKHGRINEQRGRKTYTTKKRRRKAVMAMRVGSREYTKPFHNIQHGCTAVFHTMKSSGWCHTTHFDVALLVVIGERNTEGTAAGGEQKSDKDTASFPHT